MTTRRYGDDEVREIFSLATTGGTPDRSLPTDHGGLTLAELKQIAREAGIEPASVALAAVTLDARGTAAPVQRSFGLPVGLSRVVELPRAPTDREWEQLIGEFRTTFGVQGQVTNAGGLREWSHSGLHIGVEPTARGEQLRISAREDGGMALNGLGSVMTVMMLLMGTVIFAAGKPGKALIVVGLFGGMAMAAFGANLIRLPRWARRSERQMDAIAAHAVKLLSNG